MNTNYTLWQYTGYCRDNASVESIVYVQLSLYAPFYRIYTPNDFLMNNRYAVFNSKLLTRN